jgi:hypothetical protein
MNWTACTICLAFSTISAFAQAPLEDVQPLPTGALADHGLTQSRFGIDILIGQQSGIRPSFAIINNETSSFNIEGYYGGVFTRLASSEALGAGLRWVTTRSGGRNCIILGPGVDIFFHTNDREGIVLGPSVDIAWHHRIGENGAFHLGINAGVGIGLSGYQSSGQRDPIAGRVASLISLYSGFRW